MSRSLTPMGFHIPSLTTGATTFATAASTTTATNWTNSGDGGASSTTEAGATPTAFIITVGPGAGQHRLHVPSLPPLSAVLEDIEAPRLLNNYQQHLVPNMTAYDMVSLCNSTKGSAFYGINNRTPATDDIENMYQYFNACMAYTNITYRQMTDFPIPKEYTEEIIDKYNISLVKANNETTDFMVGLADHLVGTGASLLNLLCGALKCDEDEKTPPCAVNNLLYDLTVDHTGPPWTVLNYDQSIKCQGAICQRAVDLMTTDQDIGGVGVFLSYALLVLIAIIIGSITFVDWLIVSFRARPDQKRETFFQSEPYVNLVLNFHKTQIFFTGSLVVAAFIKSRTGSIVVLDELLLFVLALQGVTLISFTLLPVYMSTNGKRSWFIYSLSLVAFILCLTFTLISLHFRAFELGKFSLAIIFCASYFESQNFAGNPRITENTIAFLLKSGAEIPAGVIIVIAVWCTLIMICTFTYQLSTHVNVIPRAFSKFWSRNRRVLKIVVAIFVVLPYMGCIGLNVYLLKKFWGVIDYHKWGFGQVVAVSVWIPLVADYVHDQYHYTLAKMRRGDKSRRSSIDRVAIAHLPQKPGFSTPPLAGTGAEYEYGGYRELRYEVIDLYKPRDAL